MLKKVLLTREEKRVIKRIARVQIKGLEKILKGDGYTDLKLFSIQNDLTEQEIREEVLEDLNLYRALKDKPHDLFNFNEDQLPIAKHVMWNFAEHPKYHEGRAKVWTKLLWLETLNPQ